MDAATEARELARRQRETAAAASTRPELAQICAANDQVSLLPAALAVRPRPWVSAPG
jgi:hypothetical protein